MPIKPFGVAKRRLARDLDTESRSRLGKAIAARTVAAAGDCSRHVAVVTGDAGVAAWADRRGARVIREPSESSLDQAARLAVAAARRLGLAWLIVHADLPLVTGPDLAAAAGAIPDGGIVLAPSHDGGTSVVGGRVEEFTFAYGPGSFRLHLAAAARRPVRVVVRTGLALDLDGPEDLRTALRLDRGSWLREIL